jgi:hypothetical protein
MGEEERDAQGQHVLHSVVIKGFASSDALIASTGMSGEDVAMMLEALRSRGLVQWRDGRISGWAPTPEGRRQHTLLLGGPLAPGDVDRVRETYPDFARINAEFKGLCTRWQLRTDQGDPPVPNDHADAAYDQGLVDELARLDDRVEGLLLGLVGSFGRIQHYQRRLADALMALRAGDKDKFVRPLYESYHDVWMELHHDLITTLGLKRTAADV